jgi:hypothetical protein
LNLTKPHRSNGYQELSPADGKWSYATATDGPIYTATIVPQPKPTEQGIPSIRLERTGDYSFKFPGISQYMKDSFDHIVCPRDLTSCAAIMGESLLRSAQNGGPSADLLFMNPMALPEFTNGDLLNILTRVKDYGEAIVRAGGYYGLEATAVSSLTTVAAFLAWGYYQDAFDIQDDFSLPKDLVEEQKKKKCPKPENQPFCANCRLPQLKQCMPPVKVGNFRIATLVALQLLEWKHTLRRKSNSESEC